MGAFRPNWRRSQQQQIPMQHRQRWHLPDARSTVADEPRGDERPVGADARPDDAHRDVAPDDVLLVGAALAAPHLAGDCPAHAGR
jgi:hypothetical protein